MNLEQDMHLVSENVIILFVLTGDGVLADPEIHVRHKAFLTAIFSAVGPTDNE